MQDYLNLMQNRSSIRAYTQEKISKENLEYILECARLSPSSLGLEPWKFLVFQKDEHKKEIAKIANNQSHVANCAAIIVVISRADFKDYFEEKLKKRGLNQEELNKRLLTYKPFLDAMNLEQSFIYAKEQSYLAIANIINAAYSLNLGSCIIGGFDKDKINQYLNLDTTKQRVSMLITLGHTQENTSVEKARFAFDEVVEFKD
ncbi:NAD(P)H-dependent oxidoreductase [Campylobacter lari]|uniref:NAD(P)H-dependent oxidoreductase n=1 Tax=Campylobacter lari TaxID=201 RepID=UPI00144BC1D2|nr:NAD(P)H-dependent oxidoreductase [Campylobacter lari]MBT0758939.1 NAD(P)H-dependent oxidoreductase [Campylobacter lari]MCR6525914.1 NAD(P)H-dependent oxidoreductase [Campylobacter lari]MCR6775120.1 NAD(P)H-dependent oxidoreductase [Campylobacter lari]MCV3445610.1 NAD(P)H-dependent oxidoreductase [Campylobacter lari]